MTPYYNKPNRAGLRAHFEAVAEAAGETPVILYNIPSRCVINLDPDFMAELAAEIPNVAAVKQANNDELGPIEGLDVLAGNDEIFLRCLELGGAGGILVSSHLAGSRMRDLYDAAAAGDFDRAREIDESLRPIYEATTVTANPIPVKAGVEMLGLIGGRLRLPMVAADDEQRAAVRSALERNGLRWPPALSRTDSDGAPAHPAARRARRDRQEHDRDRARRAHRRRRHGPDVPDRRDARDRPRAARLLVPARARRRHRGDRADPRTRGPRRRAALRAARDRDAAERSTAAR